MSYLESGTRQWNKHETPDGLLYNSIEPLVTLVVLAWDALFTALCPPSFKKSFSHIQNSPSWESKLGFTASFIARVHRLPQTVNSLMSQRVWVSVCLSPSTLSCGTSVSAQKPTTAKDISKFSPYSPEPPPMIMSIWFPHSWSRKIYHMLHSLSTKEKDG